MSKIAKDGYEDERPIRRRRARDNSGRSYLWDSAAERWKVPVPKKTKKLYCVSLVNPGSTKGAIEEYLSAFSGFQATEDFKKIHPGSKDVYFSRVPNNWETRFPLLWKRIGIEAARENYYRWRKDWNFIWAQITTDYEKRYKAWLESWVNMWGDIGYYKWDHRSRFDYLEVD